MLSQSLYHTYKRYRTLQTHRISALPLVILMPHSACNCRCVMCDIWKGNRNLKQLTRKDVEGLLQTLRAFDTQQVLFSGGEALLNPLFFDFCELLQKENIRITLLSTGLTIKQHAAELVELVNDIVISIDGNEPLHDSIRNIPGAFRKMKEGIETIHTLDPGYQVTGRSVIHKLNFRSWPSIIDSAVEMGLNQVSFLPADVSSNAFNRETTWDSNRQDDVRLSKEELPELQLVIDYLQTEYAHYFTNHFIAESPEKIQKIAAYYAAQHGMAAFPYKKCNAPWVSVVIEADGKVRPCFFHKEIGNIRESSLDAILNSEEAISFRKGLDMSSNETCIKCVCYLNLSPGSALV